MPWLLISVLLQRIGAEAFKELLSTDTGSTFSSSDFSLR